MSNSNDANLDIKFSFKVDQEPVLKDINAINAQFGNMSDTLKDAVRDANNLSLSITNTRKQVVNTNSKHKQSYMDTQSLINTENEKLAKMNEVLVNARTAWERVNEAKASGLTVSESEYASAELEFQRASTEVDKITSTIVQLNDALSNNAYVQNMRVLKSEVSEFLAKYEQIKKIASELSALQAEEARQAQRKIEDAKREEEIRKEQQKILQDASEIEAEIQLEQEALQLEQERLDILREEELARDDKIAAMRSLRDAGVPSEFTTKIGSMALDLPIDVYWQFLNLQNELIDATTRYRIEVENQGAASKELQEEYDALINSYKELVASVDTKSIPDAKKVIDIEVDTSSLTNMQLLSAELQDALHAEKEWAKRKPFSLGDPGYDALIQKIAILKQEQKEYKDALIKTAMAERERQKAMESGRLADETEKWVANEDVQMTQQRVTTMDALHNAYVKLIKIMHVFGIGTKSNTRSNSKLNNSFKTLKNNMMKGIRIFTKYVLGFRSLFFLVRRLRGIVKEGTDNLYQFDAANNETHAALDQLSTSMLFLKNAWGAAFAPILNVVLPILNSFIDKLAEVANAIANAFAFLTGRGTVIKATKTFKEYAESLDKAGGGAGKANEEAKELKRTLMGFDELNLLNGPDKDKDSGGGGGGASAGPSINDMFETVETAPVKLITDLQNAWLNSDFTEIGVKMATEIIAGFKSIPWPDIQEFMGNLGKDLATFLNGLFAPTQGTSVLQEVGTALAELTNTVVAFFASFANNFNFLEFGTQFAEMINNFFTDTDWKQFGNTISNWVTGLVNTIAMFLMNLDVSAITDAVVDIFTGIDWAQVGYTILTLIASVATLVVEGATAAWSSVFELFASLFETCGCDTIAGFWKGLSESIKGVADDFREFATEYVIEPFKDLFGIHSPSTLFEGFGVNLVEGLINGISSLIDSVIAKWELLKSNTEEVFNRIKTSLVTIANTIKTNVSAVFTNMKTAIVGAFTLMKSKVAGIFSALKEVIKSPINSILGFIETLANGVVNGVNTLLGALNRINIDLPDEAVSTLNAIPGVNIPSHLSFNFPTVGQVSLPRLAQGAVIPPNREFLAMLGDQSHGTNIEAPLDTIKQAVAEELSSQIEAMMAGFEAVVRAIEEKDMSVAIGDRDIGQANARYNRRQALIRGTR